MMIVSALFRQFGSCFGLFGIPGQTQYTNEFALSGKQARKACQRLAFLPVSKACTNEFDIFVKCMIIVYYISIPYQVAGFVC
jgi:hypothetical protein